MNQPDSLNLTKKLAAGLRTRFGASNWAFAFLSGKCLDKGGRWHYEEKKCELNEFGADMDRCLNDNGTWNYETNTCEGKVLEGQQRTGNSGGTMRDFSKE